MTRTLLAPPKRRKNATATLEYKVKVLDYFRSSKLGVTETAKLFSIERSTLQTWIRNEAKLRSAPDKRRARQVPGSGRTPESKPFEQAIVAHVQEMHAAGKTLSRTQIIKHCMDHYDIFKGKTYNAHHQWVNRFVKRNNLAKFIIKDVRFHKATDSTDTEGDNAANATTVSTSSEPVAADLPCAVDFAQLEAELQLQRQKDALQQEGEPAATPMLANALPVHHPVAIHLNPAE